MKTESSSFRDPAGFVFHDHGSLYRQINKWAQVDYQKLKSSRLFESLWEEGLLVQHQEVDHPGFNSEKFLVIQPEKLRLITYPYEWSFHQLKEAALCTLKVQRRAIEKGFSLKDASAFNIQFHQNKAIFIDTLSFEPLKENQPWVAYKQFCQHFLCPLALAAYHSSSALTSLRQSLNGVDLKLTSDFLPFRSWFHKGPLLHIHLHSRFEQKTTTGPTQKKQIARPFSLNAHRGLIDSLMSAIEKLPLSTSPSEWESYYDRTNYSDPAIQQKEAFIEDFFSQHPHLKVLDLGANTGRFSRLAARSASQVLSTDYDPKCIDINFQVSRKEGHQNIDHAVLDLTNPTPDLGWRNLERTTLRKRFSADATMALALIHHLRISGNLSFEQIAEGFQELTEKYFLIEYVGFEDSQIQEMVALRTTESFADYTLENFKGAFAKYFTQIAHLPISGTARSLFIYEKR